MSKNSSKSGVARRSAGTSPSTIAIGTPEAFPGKMLPMLAELADAPFADPTWLFEPKLDGYRMLAFVRGGTVSLMSRRALDYTRLFPSITSELASATSKDCILDGEIIALDPEGRPSFNALQNRSGLKTERQVAAAEVRAPVVFFYFDVLHYAGRNVRDISYVERRDLLASTIKASSRLQLTLAMDDGIELYTAALKSGFGESSRNDAVPFIARAAGRRTGSKSNTACLRNS